jgi:adenosylmethionine-8-amino-7-oxononanoate aminotransferase
MSGSVEKPISVPWFGSRKFARHLVAELADTQSRYVIAREQLARFTAMGSQLVAELKDAKQARDTAVEQIERLGLLSAFELQRHQQELEKETAEQTMRLQREKAEAAQSLETMRAELKKAHAGIVATDDLTRISHTVFA